MSDLEPEVSNRGFKHFGHIVSTRQDPEEFIRTYESSNMDGPNIWLSIQSQVNFKDQSTFNNDYAPRIVTAVELTAEDALQLANQLIHLVHNHYQNG